MKNVLIVFLIMGVGAGYAQGSGYPPQEGSTLDAGLGMAWIDNQAYYSISFQPDISIGKFGMGIGVQLLYNTKTGSLRAQDWNTSSDYARLIRYLRYGHKGDRLYTRMGALDAERLGHGFIINYFNNQLNYDERKQGLVLDIDFGSFGFESMTNTLGRWGLIAGRMYYRPLHRSAVPVIKNFALGASYATDLDPDAWKGTTEDRVSIWGVDVELPVIKSGFFDMILYADYAKIAGYGSGKTAGLRTDLNGLFGLINVGVNLERRFLGEKFIAGYFGPFYDVLGYSTMGEMIDFYESLGGDTLGIPQEYLPVMENTRVSQKMLLPMMTGKRSGWYAGLYADFLHLIKVVGSFEMMDNENESGNLHMGAGLSQSIPFLALEACYDKRGISTFRDISTLDFRSLARVGIGYKMTPFLLLYLDYIWSFKWDEALQQFRPQERFQPRLAFRYHF